MGREASERNGDGDESSGEDEELGGQRVLKACSRFLFFSQC